MALCFKECSVKPTAVCWWHCHSCLRQANSVSSTTHYFIHRRYFLCAASSNMTSTVLLLILASLVVCFTQNVDTLQPASRQEYKISKRLGPRATIHQSCNEAQRQRIEATIPHLRTLALLGKITTRNLRNDPWTEARFIAHFGQHEDERIVRLLIHQRYRAIYFETDFSPSLPGDREHVDIRCEDVARRCLNNPSGGYVDSLTGRYIVLVCLQIKNSSPFEPPTSPAALR